MSSRFLRLVVQQPKLPSRHIPAHVKDAYTGKISSDGSPMKYVWQFRKDAIRKRYAAFGKDSGLKAGACWPSRDELNFMKQYEATFEKSFQHMSKTVQQEKADEAKKRLMREEEIVKNLAKLPQQKQEFWKNYHQLYEDIEKEKIKKEKVIQEVREFLGYNIEPNDPRFEEALLKKDEEEKAALRAARKLEKQRQNMEMLQALVNEALEKEKEGAKKSGAKQPPAPEKKAS